MVAIQSTAEPPPPESPKGPGLQPDFSVAPVRPFPLTVGFCLTSQGQLGPGKEMPRLGPNRDTGPGAIQPARPAVLLQGYSSPVGRQPGTS